MRKASAVFLFAGWTLLSVAGCGPGGKAVAMVNGEAITVRDLDQRMARSNPSYRAALGNDRRRFLEDLVMEKILLQEARRRNLDRDSEVQTLLREARRQILVGRLLERIREEAKAQISDQEILQFYQANQNRFTEPQTLRASHILAADEKTAKIALERVKKGESFAKVAQELSIDPTKTKGGDIGPFTKGQIIPEFEEACEKLKPRELSPVVKTSLGYHVILLTERQPARIQSLEEVRDQIKRQLVAQQQQHQVEAVMQDLRARAQVKIWEQAVTGSNP